MCADFFRFAFMAMPHVKDAPCNSAGSPGKHDKALIKPTDSNEARLTVVTARIRPREVRAGKDLLCTKHIEAAFEQRLLPFGPIARDAHALL
jgi:hypothetical protein